MSDLEDLYREIILDHYRSPRNRGELDSPPAQRIEGFNPLCGDEVVVSLLVRDGTLTDIKIKGTGCSISQSSASLMSSAVKGKRVDEVRHLISTFKGMMSIHESSFGDGGSDGNGSGDGDGGDVGFYGGSAPTRNDGLWPGPETVAGEPEQIDSDELGELAALQGVVKFPVRIKCATLSWNALSRGLNEVETSG